MKEIDLGFGQNAKLIKKIYPLQGVLWGKLFGRRCQRSGACLTLAPFSNSGEDWVLHLLDGRPELERTRILMTLWRIWHVRNEIVYDKPAPSVESSRRFLCSYVDSLMTIK